MNIRWPLCISVDRRAWRERRHFAEGHSLFSVREWRTVRVDWMMDWTWIAPKPLAWFYRLLPYHAGFNTKTWRDEGSHPFFSLVTPTWGIWIGPGFTVAGGGGDE